MAIAIGVYPLIYFVFDMSAQGILATKSQELREAYWWQLFFYLHISGGGIALLVGWVQFWEKIRLKYLSWHRRIGYLYVVCVLTAGGIGGLVIAQFATGGWVSRTGFTSLALLWLFSTCMMLVSVKLGKLEQHREWAIRSYGLTLAAVTLRLWLPLLSVYYQEFLPAYLIVSWLCWIPNLLITECIIYYSKNRKTTAPPLSMA